MLFCLAISTFQNCRKKGSETAKIVLKNEDTIRDKFNGNKPMNKKNGSKIMGFKLNEIQNVSTYKLHGYKADVEVKIKTKTEEKRSEFRLNLSVRSLVLTKLINVGWRLIKCGKFQRRRRSLKTFFLVKLHEQTFKRTQPYVSSTELDKES